MLPLRHRGTEYHCDICFLTVNLCALVPLWHSYYEVISIIIKFT